MDGSLGLLPAELPIYHAALARSHRPRWTYDLLDLDDNLLARIPGPPDGVITGSADDDVTRGYTGTLYDADHLARFDTASPSDGSIHLDRILRAQHTIWVRELGRTVTSTPFYGWLTKAERDGKNIVLEGQGLERRGLFGQHELHIPAGTYVVDAIRTILAQRMGEVRFRFPAHAGARLTKHVNVGLSAETAPWPISKTLAANLLDMQLLFSCDGWPTLRAYPTEPVAELLIPGNITSEPKSTSDALASINYADVNGRRKVHAYAAAEDDNPLSSKALARHGVQFLMPSTVDDAKYTSNKQAQVAADRYLKAGLPENFDQTMTLVPMAHFDVLDMLRLTAPEYTSTLRMRSFSCPATGDEMTLNRRQLVTKAKRGTRARA